MRQPWEDAVRLLRELDGQETAAQFKIGDIVLEQVPLGEQGVRDGSYEVIQRLADESGISFNTLLERRKIASMFPDNVRTLSVSYSVFVLLGTREDPSERQRLLTMIRTEPASSRSGRWTVDLLRKHLGIRPTRYPPPEDATPETKTQIFQELAADPDIAQETQQAVFQTLAATPAIAEGYADISSPTARAVGELHRKARDIHERRHQERLRTDPVEKRFDETYAALDVEQACRRFATETEKFVQAILVLTPRLGQAGADDRYWIMQSIERARATLDQLEVFATTGKSDLEGFLEETLGKR